MPFSIVIATAVKSLAGTMQRTLLALFGIAVGIGAVTALVTTGTIARSEALKQFEALGTDLLSLHGFSVASSARTAADLTRDNIIGLPALSTIDSTAPFVINSGELSGAGERQRVQVVGVTSDMAELADIELESGRFLSPLDGNRPFAVIGADVARQLDRMGRESGVGARVKVRGTLYTIIGVLKPGSRGPAAIRRNETLFVPLGHAMRTAGASELTGVILRMPPGVHYLAATAEVEEHLRRVAPHLQTRVDSPVEIIEQMDAQMRLFAILLGAVGGVALVVGGFGVMNAMLASISEQRLEIGIRRALGARRADIQRQVLAESSILSLAGGAAGCLLGVGVTLGVSLFAGWTWQLSWGALLLGVLTAVAVGLFFGYYPARQAARLDPIVALRMG